MTRHDLVFLVTQSRAWPLTESDPTRWLLSAAQRTPHTQPIVPRILRERIRSRGAGAGPTLETYSPSRLGAENGRHPGSRRLEESEWSHVECRGRLTKPARESRQASVEHRAFPRPL